MLDSVALVFGTFTPLSGGLLVTQCYLATIHPYGCMSLSSVPFDLCNIPLCDQSTRLTCLWLVYEHSCVSSLVQRCEPLKAERGVEAQDWRACDVQVFMGTLSSFPKWFPQLAFSPVKQARPMGATAPLADTAPTGQRKLESRCGPDRTASIPNVHLSTVITAKQTVSSMKYPNLFPLL